MVLFRQAAPLGAITLALVAACGGGATPAPPPQGTAPGSPAGGSAAAGVPSTGCATGSITSAGSTALEPLVEQAAQLYTTGCPGSTVNVQGGGSGTGLTQVSQGAIEIGNSDVLAGEKLASPDAQSLLDHQVARQGWIIVLNPGVTGVTNLTTDQSARIWTGQTTNWNQVGGPDLPIVLILRPASSGTRATFKKIVLGGADEAAGQALTEDSNGAVTDAVAQTPGATSVIGLAYYEDNKDKVTGVQLDGVDASIDTIKDGSYTLQAFGHLYTKPDPTGLTKSFLDYMLSPEIQGQLLPSLFYAPVQ